MWLACQEQSVRGPAHRAPVPDPDQQAAAIWGLLANGDSMHQLRFPAQQFRAMPAPSGRARVGLFYCPASAIPSELMDWRGVKPREGNTANGPLKAILRTRLSESERFH